MEAVSRPAAACAVRPLSADFRKLSVSRGVASAAYRAPPIDVVVVTVAAAGDRTVRRVGRLSYASQRPSTCVNAAAPADYHHWTMPPPLGNGLGSINAVSFDRRLDYIMTPSSRILSVTCKVRICRKKLRRHSCQRRTKDRVAVGVDEAREFQKKCDRQRILLDSNKLFIPYEDSHNLI